MARVDIHALRGQTGAGYVLDVQAPLLDHITTRVVVPLVPRAGAPLPIRDLNPIFEIGGVSHVMLTQALASIPTRELGPSVGSLMERHHDVTKALDVLLLGF